MSSQHFPADDIRPNYSLISDGGASPRSHEASELVPAFPPVELAQLVLDQAPCAMLLLDERANVLHANATLKRWLGRCPQDAICAVALRKALGLDAPETSQLVIGAVDAAKRSLPPPTFDLRLTRPDGTSMALLAVSSAVRTQTGDFLACALTLSDITERQKTEAHALHANEAMEARVAQQTAKLTRAERLYSLMADALQDSCIFFLDVDGRITEWSESAHRLHGFSEEEVLGKLYASMTVSMNGEQEEISPADAIRLAVQRGQWELRGWRRRADSHPFWAHTLITALRGADNELEGLSCITRDMTAAKDLDKVMNDLNGELERRVLERVRQYVVPNRDLDVFTHHITHDLRGPLRHINTYSGLMLEGLAGATFEGADLYRDGLRAATKRLNCMVESLLNYARIGRIDIHAAPVPLGSLVAGLIPRVMEAYPGLQVSWTIPEDLPVVVVDPVLVIDLLSHVLDNAVKFSRMQPTPEIQIGWVQEAAGWGQFFVVDNGVGFDVSKASNLFVMFARQHHSLDFPGSGAGLSLAQRIVQRHGGKIWADSTPNHGCVLYFTLPLA